MLDRPGTSLRFSSAIVVLAGYLALACVPGYSWLLMTIPLLPLLLAPMGEHYHRTYPLYRLVSRGVTIAYFCFLPLTAVLFGLIPSLIMLIMFIQCHTLVHPKQERNYHYLYLMTFFLVLAACVQSPEPWIAFVLLFLVIGIAWALSALRLAADPRLSRTHALPEIESLLATPGTRERSPRHRVALLLSVGAATVTILVLTSFFFVVTPRVEAGFLGRESQLLRMTGFSQTVDLQGGAYVQEDPTPVLTVEFPEERRGMFSQANMYWRVTTLPSYRESRWSRKGLDRHYYAGVDAIFATNLEEFRQTLGNEIEVARHTVPGSTRTVMQRIFSDRMPEEGVPTLDLPVKIAIEGRSGGKQVTWDGRQDMTLRLTRSSSNQLDYTAWSELLDPSADVLRQMPMLFDSLTPADLEMLLEHDLLPETQELARALTQDADNPYDKVMAIMTFLSGPDFLYTLNLPPLPAQNAIDEFILRVRLGHCEFFASAMALMLRSVGIPTRVVSGYRGGDWSEGAGAYIVRQSMAHLWVEVYFEDFGWVRFDPAPRSEEAALEGFAAVMQRLNDLQLRAKLFWYREVISFDRGLQIERLRSLPGGIMRSFGFGQSLEEAANARPNSQGNPVLPIAIVLVALASVAMASYLLRRRKQTGLPLTSDQRRAVLMYGRLRDRLAKAKLPIAGMSAEEIEATVVDLGWPEAAEVGEILRHYNEARFGQRPMEQGILTSLLERVRALRLPGQQESARG